jgi:hypothetical protein
MAGAQAAVEGIAALKDGHLEVRALQDYHSANRYLDNQEDHRADDRASESRRG